MESHDYPLPEKNKNILQLNLICITEKLSSTFSNKMFLDFLNQFKNNISCFADNQEDKVKGGKLKWVILNKKKTRKESVILTLHIITWHCLMNAEYFRENTLQHYHKAVTSFGLSGPCFGEDIILSLRATTQNVDHLLSSYSYLGDAVGIFY